MGDSTHIAIAARIWWEHNKFECDPDFVKQIDPELVGGHPVDVARMTRPMLDEFDNLDGKDAKRSRQMVRR
jgi:hypothetical protein